MSAGKRVNIRKIAQICGVSSATVSRVLNNKPDVSQEARRKVMDTIRKIQYAPKLTSSPSNILGVTIEYPHAFSSSYLTALMDPIEDTSMENGYDLLILRNESLRQVESGMDLHLRRKMVSGIIILLASANDAFPERIAATGFPHIAVNTRRPEKVNFIDEDSYGGVFEATQHLLSLGHKRIAFINPAPHMFVHQERLRAYREAMELSSQGFNPGWVVESVSNAAEEIGYQAIMTALRRDSGVTAAMCQADYLPGVLRFFKEKGIVCPDDFSLIAFDDAPLLTYSSPSISCVAQNVTRLGQQAVQEVVRQIENGGQVQTIVQAVLPTQLIMRQSTAGAPQTSVAAVG